MHPVNYLFISLALLGASHAMNIRGFWTTHCRNPSFMTGYCDHIPQNTCCKFTPNDAPMGHDNGNTKSVEWTGISTCQIMTWYDGAGQHLNCGGRVLDSFSSGNNGGVTRHCMSRTRNNPTTVHDGAEWKFVIDVAKGKGWHVAENSECGQTKDWGDDIIAEALDITKDMGVSGSVGQGFFGPMSLALKCKRGHMVHQFQERAAADFAEELVGSCKGVQYATHTGWTPGTGVWVLEGSEENHNRLIDAANNKILGWNARLKAAGAVFYDHWAEHTIIRDDMLERGYKFTDEDITRSKAKRSLNEDPPIEDIFPDVEEESEDTPVENEDTP